MKPVEIEFLMKDRLTPGLGKAGKSIDELAAKASLTQDELEAVNLRMQDLRNIIALLDAQMEQLRLAGANASPIWIRVPTLPGLKLCRRKSGNWKHSWYS